MFGTDTFGGALFGGGPVFGVGQALTKSVADALTLADTRTNFANKSLAEVLAIADAKTLTVSKVLAADTLALADALAKLPGKAISDSATLADGIAKNIGGVFSDPCTFAEQVAKAVSKPLTDPVTLGDTVQAVITLVLSIADGFGISDAKRLELRKALSEAVTVQSIIAALFTAKALGDTITLLDVAAKIVGKPLADAFALGDLSTAQIVAIVSYIIEHPLSVIQEDTGLVLDIIHSELHVS